MFFLYFILWIVLNGRITLEICLIGLVVAAVLFAFTCRFMDHSIAKERVIITKAWDFVCYVVVLVREIIRANFAVIHMILSEREELVPTLVSFRSELKTPTCRALLANAITLTPGTITVSLEGDEYTVHCLDESLAEGIDRSVFVEQISGLEKGTVAEEEEDV